MIEMKETLSSSTRFVDVRLVFWLARRLRTGCSSSYYLVEVSSIIFANKAEKGKYSCRVRGTRNRA